MPAPLTHGGDLAEARRLFPDAPTPFVDLSTGINPHSYPLPGLPAEAFARLPGRADLEQLLAVAAEAYGAPSAACVLAAPGTQILLPQIAALAPAGRAAILSPTYAEHARAAALAGHRASEVADIALLKGADVATVVNPNNPDGRLRPRDELLALADTVGLLVIDETFMDVGPAGASLARDVLRGNVVVLRSLGKFFGLAGVRLGFALAAPEIAARLDAVLGPWAVSGPALAIGMAALADRAWATAMRATLAASASRLDALLTGAGLEVVGGTSLFRLARTPNAADIFNRLGRAGVLVRRFQVQPTWLRFGLPRDHDAWQRLGAALR